MELINEQKEAGVYEVEFNGVIYPVELIYTESLQEVLFRRGR